MTNAEKGKLGEKYVSNYLKSKGFSVILSKENGSDLIAKKQARSIRIEVKTTSNLAGGIPDMHTTEFEKKKRNWLFVADYLYIVRLNDRAIPTQLDILTKKEIDKYANSHKTVIRVRTTKLDKDLNKGNVGKSIQL